jgi:hypothetical protein
MGLAFHRLEILYQPNNIPHHTLSGDIRSGMTNVNSRPTVYIFHNVKQTNILPPGTGLSRDKDGRSADQ